MYFKGYLYIIFESDEMVKAMLNTCKKHESYEGKYYHVVSSRKLKHKEVHRNTIGLLAAENMLF